MGILSWIIILPLLTAAVISLLPEKKFHFIRWIAFFGTFTNVILSAVAAYIYKTTIPDVNTHNIQLHLTERITWFPSLGIEYFIGIDGISLSMIILTSIVIFTGVLASWEVQYRTKEFFILLLVLVSGVFGVFVSFDLFLFFMFYEVAVLPMYLLIGVWGTGKKEYSAMKLTIMLIFGSALILVGFLALSSQSAHSTFNLVELAGISFPVSFQKWVFPIIFIGFGVLGALYPFHTWSPDGHASAPTAVSMLHAGVLMKLGGYGALRIALYLLPEGAKIWAIVFMILTTINIVYGAFAAIAQKDLKYFTAYSSVSHCGFVLFGLSTLTLMGIKGAVIQMFSHGIMTALFFALIGMVYGRTHTRMIHEMGGLAKVMPWLTTCFYIGGMASLGLPGLAGFIAESHVFLGGFFADTNIVPLAQILTLIATASIVITAVYVLRGLAKVFHGPLENEHYHHLSDATFPDRMATGILVCTLIFVGIFPSLFSELIQGSVEQIIQRIQAVSITTALFSPLG